MTDTELKLLAKQYARKALGKIYQNLLKSRQIVTTGGYRKRNQGNASAIYARKRN